MWPIRNQDVIISSCRNERLEEDLNRTRLFERLCVPYVVCHDELINER